MRWAIVVTALLAGVYARSAGAEEPRIGLTLGRSEGTAVGTVIRISDRLTSRTALRLPSWGGASAEFDLTYDALRGHVLVPYVGAGIALLQDDFGGRGRKESRALVGVRHHATQHVRLFGDAVWYRRIDGPPGPFDEYVNIRLGAGVSVMF